MTDYEALTGIEALEGCKLCGRKDPAKPLSDSFALHSAQNFKTGDDRLYVIDNHMWVFQNDGEAYLDDIFEIKYCPLCGRRLKSDDTLF